MNEQSYNYEPTNHQQTDSSVKPMDHESLHFIDCSYNLNFNETTRRYSNEYHNYFNDGMMAPVIGKVQCQEIRFFKSYSNFETTFFGLFYSKVHSTIDQVNVNLFTQDIHQFYPIVSTYQVITIDDNEFIDICGNVSMLVSELTNDGKEPLLTLYPHLNFTSCEQFFCNVNESLYDPFNVYFRAQNYSQVFQHSKTTMLFYRDLHIFSMLTNRCQYCKSEKQFRVRVQNNECLFMVNFPARSAERSCMGKNGFAVFYPFMALDQYLQPTGNPFMCYCYENSIYAGRCDSLHTFIFPIYSATHYMELSIEIVFFCVITVVLVLPLLRDVYNRGLFFFKDFDLILRLLSTIPFWLFRIIYNILKVTSDSAVQGDIIGRTMNSLIHISLDTIGFDYVFIPLVIKWNQTYQKIKLFTKDNADLDRKKTYRSSIIMMIFYYVITIGCELVICIISLTLKYAPKMFADDGISSELLFIVLLTLISIPTVITLTGFAILSILIQRKLKQASDISFVQTNYVSTSRTYILVSLAQFIPTVISALTLYFGYDSITATLYFLSSVTMKVTTDILEIYVIIILIDGQSLKGFYQEFIWFRISPILCCFSKKVASVVGISQSQGSDVIVSSTDSSKTTIGFSDAYYKKM